MASRRMWVRIENFLPCIISFIVFLFITYINTYVNVNDNNKIMIRAINLGENYKELLSSLMTIVTIFIALITMVETLIISLSEHKTIKRFQSNNKTFSAFLSQLLSLIISNIIVVLFCLWHIMYSKQTIEFNSYGILFLLSMIYSLVTFCWVEFLFFLMAKHPS